MAKLSESLSVEYGLPAFFQAIADLSPSDAVRVLHSFNAGLDAVALEYQRQWRAYAQGEPIPGTARRIHSKGPYTNSIQVDLKKDFEKRVYTDYKYARNIEEGHGEIDLKKDGGPRGGLLHGPKARLTKMRMRAGKIQGMPHAYNIVSFRHGSPSTSTNPMPKDIYSQVQKLFAQAKQANFQVASEIVSRDGGKIVAHPDHGHLRDLPRYNWGVRTGELGERKTKATGYKWATGKQSGMTRMKGGGYRTFRTVSATSPKGSWIVPPLKGIPIRQIVVNTLHRKRVAEKILYDSMARDFGMGGHQERKG